ncbi:DUF971 domain-containing protein [Acuticoccus sp. M5D2P5]|uniref:gamma-butyrobetaine hydroxylase-like domain-containing protein n=1 Tax=Acuticoccus kalidii TaxID=2910977 RepID=UPI001F27704E|nr:DUF971 domain-containing protein [Acuticoccus kalidii]MCF3933155.1 DUF971 domain-containing protein [Acuticoccus kalidii]
MQSLPPWPTELRVNAARTELTVRYDEGEAQTLTAEFLRVQTPSAERKGHGARNVIGGKQGVTIEDVRPVGRYAVRIVFSDGHDSGLYTFDYLRELGEGRDTLWQTYLGELEAHGLDRERPGTASVSPSS